MKICEVTALLEQEGTWVRRNMKTRDHLLFGDDQQEVGRIGICWVASKGAILAAVKQKVNFIITHENPFYQCSTQMYTAAIKAAEEKKRILQEHGISVYRCHDVWDCIKEYGVADQWAFRLGFKFEERIVSSYYQAASIPEMTAEALAHHVAKVLRQDGEQGVYMFGDPQKKIHRIAIGCGAATNLYELLEFYPDAVIVSDDGINNYDAAQYAIDQHIPMIVVNHAGCEIAGCKAMVPWLMRHLHSSSICYLDEGYTIHYYTTDS